MRLKDIINETFTSGCVSTVPSIFGDIQKRTSNVDYSKYNVRDNSSYYVRLGNAMREFIKDNGVITSEDIYNIKKVLDK